jgi:hypothetical protein
MSDIFQRFKQVFISPQNTEYILGSVSSKFPHIDSSSFQQNFKTTLIELQNVIYNTYFTHICNDLHKKRRFNLEESLLVLNKLSIEKLEYVVNTTSPPPQSVWTNQTNQSPPIEQSVTQQPPTEQSVTQLSQDPEQAHFHHFFSKDAQLLSGKYIFKFDMDNINSLALTSFKLDCNIYNITELNNKFSVFENGDIFTVSIPFGYYNLDVLLTTISDLLNNESPNKYTYILKRNKIKNKVYIECTSNNMMPCSFNIMFEDTREFSSYSLQEILGFSQNEYNNNNLYVSENHPIDNIFDQFFIKLFINEKEISRFSSTSPNFSYFHSFHVDMNNFFGKTFYLQNSFNDSFDILEDVSSSEISIELWNSQTHILTRFVDFELVMFFEYN